MGVKLSIETEENFKSAMLKMAGVLILAFLCFVIAALLSLSLSLLVQHGFNAKSFALLEAFYLRIWENPLFLFSSYGKWWELFLMGLERKRFILSLYIPLAAPLVSLIILGVAYVKSSYSFVLWYILNHHFAKEKDVEEMRLVDTGMMAIGRFGSHILGIQAPDSVLCFGEAGSGKTSSVAIPSILQSDRACVLAIDNDAVLAKYTSGYRSMAGRVFYFNWDMVDDPEKGSYYPRWNPLSISDLPPKGEVRDSYLAFIASYLSSYEQSLDRDNYWEWLTFKAINSFLSFMVCKVSQAMANDYFLNTIIEKGRLSKDDKDILLSYYVLMPQQYSAQAIADIDKEKLTIDDYFPIGSWEGIPPSWQGKDLCLSMVSDWVIKNYLTNKNSPDMKCDCKEWLESLMVEAQLFNYGSEVVSGLQQLVYLSAKQRDIVFPMLLKPLMIFRNAVIRERTSGSDFKMAMLKGIRNPETRRMEPVTVYSTANTKSTKFVSRMFIEIALRQTPGTGKGRNGCPLLVVMDDVGQMLKIRSLVASLSKTKARNMSFLLLCNSLYNFENVYGKEMLEDLVAATNYKIVMAENNQKLSKQLNKLAVFGTKSVQIPVHQQMQLIKSNSFYANSVYYHRLAQDLQASRNLKIETKGYQVVLVEGYYNRPILAKNVHYLKDEEFKEKSLINACYFLDEDLVMLRNPQDEAVPALDDVFHDVDTGADDETELSQYMNIAYDEAIDKVQDAVDKTTVLVEDISSKWKKSERSHAGKDEKKTEFSDDDGDWWLTEEAFDEPSGGETSNPFEKKS